MTGQRWSGSILRGASSCEACSHASMSSVSRWVAHSITSLRWRGDRLPSITRLSRMEIWASCSAYSAWKCGGEWSPTYILMTMSRNRNSSGIRVGTQTLHDLLGCAACDFEVDGIAAEFRFFCPSDRPARSDADTLENAGSVPNFENTSTRSTREIDLTLGTVVETHPQTEVLPCLYLRRSTRCDSDQARLHHGIHRFRLQPIPETSVTTSTTPRQDITSRTRERRTHPIRVIRVRGVQAVLSESEGSDQEGSHPNAYPGSLMGRVGRLEPRLCRFCRGRRVGRWSR